MPPDFTNDKSLADYPFRRVAMVVRPAACGPGRVGVYVFALLCVFACLQL